MRTLCLITILSICSKAFSQAPVDLDPLSVTSSRNALKLSETGRNITVLDARLISSLKINSLDDLLKYAGAVEVQQRGPSGSQADLVVRGGTFQQVLVLVDGIRINDPVTGHFSAYIPVVPEQVERIEILRGPAAAIYGSEAVGAVINVITKAAAASFTQKSGTFSAGAEAGEYGYASANASYMKQSGKMIWSVGGITNNADGQKLRGNNRGYFHNNLISGSVALPIKKDWRLSLLGSYDSRDFNAQNYYTSFASDTAKETVKSYRSQLALLKEKNGRKDEFDVSLKNSTDHYLYNSLSSANKNTGMLTSFQYRHEGRHSASLLYNYGVFGELKTIRSNDRGNHGNGSVAAFSSVVYKAGGLTINPGLRYVYDQNFGNELMPQFNAAYRKHKLVLKVNAGRSVRSADFTERYNNYNKKLVTGGSIGNPDLSAEKSWSYETGADLLLKHFRISTAYFIRRQHDVIDYVPTPYAEMPRKSNLSPTGSFALAKNLKKVNTHGLEVEAIFSNQIRSLSNIYLSASATILRSHNAEGISSFYIISHAKLLVQGIATYTSGKISLTINTIYKERMPQQATAIKAYTSKDYWIVNGHVGYRIKKAELYLRINNIGNVHYSDLLGSLMPGSWTTAGVSVEL